MNLKNIKIYTAACLLAGSLAACLSSCKDSFLEILPKGRVIASKTTDYDLLLNNLDLINFSSNSQVMMGDEVVAIEPQWSSSGLSYREKQLFKWEGDIYNIDEDAAETLSPVKNLYIYNKIIDEVMQSAEGSEAVKSSLQAEAYAGRAWCNFLLVNFYGKPYTAATASTDLAFPLITKADINAQNFRRNTVQEMYDLIISDLNTAIPNLSSDGAMHRIRMSKAAAQGTLAKVYIFMGKPAEALPLLGAAIANLPKSLVNTSLVDYNAAFPGFPTVVNDQENVYVKNMSNTYIGSSNRMLWLSPEAAALYSPRDIRFIRLFLSTTFSNGLTLYKRTGTTTSNIGVRVAELYLLRAEAKARLGDLQGAAEDLLYLRKNRMPLADAAIPESAMAAQKPMLQFIMEERIREFAVTGYRWFDMRRLSADPLFAGDTYQHRVFNTSGTVSETYTLKPERFVFRFSAKVRSENPAIIDNP